MNNNVDNFCVIIVIVSTYLNIYRAVKESFLFQYTVFPRIVCARSINFTAVMLHGQFEGALYSRAQFNTD